MKKILLGTLTAATVIATVAGASAQTRMERNWFDLSVAQTTPQGGGSIGYNMNAKSFDAIK